MTEPFDVREPAVVWVAAARRRIDVNRPAMELMQVSRAERKGDLTITCTDGRRLHQASLPDYRLPLEMRDPGLFYVKKASGKVAVLQRVEPDRLDTGRNGEPKWMNWRRIMPDWDTASKLDAGLHFYEKKNSCGVVLGRFLCGFGKQTRGGMLDADLVRDLWFDGACFDARRARNGAVMFREDVAPVRLQAVVMPLDAA